MATATPAPTVPGPVGEPPVPSRRRRWWPWAATGAVLVLAVALGLWRFTGTGPAPLTKADVRQAVQDGIEQHDEDLAQVPPDAAIAYRTIRPSLVTILASHPATRDGDASLGAGVIVDDQGNVLTALHVVEGATKVQVRFADGTTSDAEVTTRRPDTDIAVLAPTTLPQVVVPAVLGGVGQVGDAVFPVGNPLGLQGSLSAGVVSALDRTVSAGSGRTLKGLIQFDAAVNPGNSGGPLLDRQGHVVGIVTGLANPAKQAYFVGIGFAVPIATAGGAAGGPQK